mmetsp:Transcript_15176/g.25202  ORF Transcript_15176/g.25202 Transcript_15176/m.25202 type:complete len:286 (+) Transcript_15176:104-961(+)|eukprot:CAMPEP_0119006142 /NCGR_PEP_ID=MMETSP1176-20130426/2134_1 /TAXON_ID=265551 /ORGANISM="Synedropsis recta cf, Strain CCMP1620" /LENGTH=285 /DNA_ID=CAMNT_0006958031 /DNA_START=104 /DNA_END=961 /DNA_ORIENTATION=-
MTDRSTGPFGIDPLHFSFALFGLLVLFVLYLLLPRGLRVQYFKAYPKRYAWSARSRARRSGRSILQPSINGSAAASSIAASGQQRMSSAGGTYSTATGTRSSDPFAQQQQLLDLQQNDEIVISAAMQQLRDPGVLIIAHGSRGKPKTVRLQLTESAITWRTETRKKGKEVNSKPKMGKLHQVPLSHIMYVDVGKQTTALRRVENAAVAEALCFSLLTKEGSLDLEANSPRERDALVSCFSLVLDEVHAQNWRDIYRGPSSDMPSSFDDFDHHQEVGGGAHGPNNV